MNSVITSWTCRHCNYDENDGTPRKDGQPIGCVICSRFRDKDGFACLTCSLVNEHKGFLCKACSTRHIEAAGIHKSSHKGKDYIQNKYKKRSKIVKAKQQLLAASARASSSPLSLQEEEEREHMEDGGLDKHPRLGGNDDEKLSPPSMTEGEEEMEVEEKQVTDLLVDGQRQLFKSQLKAMHQLARSFPTSY